MASGRGHGFTLSGKCNHPERPVSAQGLCRSCYVQAQRTGTLPGKYKKERYSKNLIEELEFHTFDWPQLERAYKRSRETLVSALRKQGRMDLVDAVDFKTFGGKPKVGRRASK